MKSQNGITLMSLLVYVVAFVIVAGVVGLITTFFYSNYSFLDDKSTAVAQYDKLNLVFVEENKTNNNYIFDLQSDIKGARNSTFFSSDDIENNNKEYDSKYSLLEDVNEKCNNFFNTYVLFYDENFIGWRADDKNIYYNQNVLCKNVDNFLITKKYENGRTILNMYVEFDTKSFSTKYTF